MRQPTRDAVTHHTLGTALATPRIRLRQATLDHRRVRLDQLADGHQPELVETAERGQVRGRESSVGHVEVFRDGEREELPSSGGTAAGQVDTHLWDEVPLEGCRCAQEVSA